MTTQAQEAALWLAPFSLLLSLRAYWNFYANAYGN